MTFMATLTFSYYLLIKNLHTTSTRSVRIFTTALRTKGKRYRTPHKRDYTVLVFNQKSYSFHYTYSLFFKI